MLSLKRSHGLLCSGQCYGKISHFHMVGSDLKTSRGHCLSPRAWLAAEAPWLSRLQGWEVPLLGRQGLPRCPTLSPWDRPPEPGPGGCGPGKCSVMDALWLSPTKGHPPSPAPAQETATGSSELAALPFPTAAVLAFLLIVPKLSSGKVKLHPGALPGMGQGLPDTVPPKQEELPLNLP